MTTATLVNEVNADEQRRRLRSGVQIGTPALFVTGPEGQRAVSDPSRAFHRSPQIARALVARRSAERASS